MLQRRPVRRIGRGQVPVVDIVLVHPDGTGGQGSGFMMTRPGLGSTDPLVMDETERQTGERARDAQGWDTAKTLAEALPYIQI